MHPPRPNNGTERQTIADRLTDWLLTHCPFSTLTLLTALVASSAVGFTFRWQVFAAIVGGDVVINAVRWRRRVKRPAHASGLRRNAAA